jgi:hypothetical protein
MTDVVALLTRHGAAVMRHDRSAFLDDVDSAAHDFRDRQATAFDNLSAVPLSSWSYAVELRTDDREAEGNATKAFGTAAIIVRIALRYQLKAVDPTPTSHDLWWTFIRYDGRVVVAADDGMTDRGGVSWQGPWDFGPLRVLRGPHSLVLAHPDHAALMPSIQVAVEAAVPTVSAVWGSDWTQAVGVLIPSSAAEATADASPQASGGFEVAANAVSDGQDPLTGAPFGQRLVIDPEVFATLTPLGVQITVRHEVTHIADAGQTSESTPRWLNEGFADYVGNLGSGQPVRQTAAELGADVRRGVLPTTLPADSAFDAAGQSPQAYEGAWLACRLIASRVGQAGLVSFYRTVGRSLLDPDSAVAAGLKSTLGVTTAQFTASWQAYLRTELG